MPYRVYEVPRRPHPTPIPLTPIFTGDAADAFRTYEELVGKNPAPDRHGYVLVDPHYFPMAGA